VTASTIAFFSQNQKGEKYRKCPPFVLSCWYQFTLNVSFSKSEIITGEKKAVGDMEKRQACIFCCY